MKKLISKILVAALVCIPPSLVVCGTVATVCTVGCKKLDPAGVYQSDKALYAADRTITEAYDVMHSFVRFEYENRAAINNPDITKAADNVRANAQTQIKSAIALRDAYAATPTPENRSKLDDAIRVLRQAISEAQGFMAKGVKKTTG